MVRRLIVPLLVAAWLLAASASAQAVPFWGAKQSMPADTPPSSLKPGEWIWGGDSKAMGAMAVIVSLDEQRAYVYRNGLLVAVSTVSTGKPGHETPTGVFTILQKDKDHRSSIYNNAPMPYQQRLTWGGIALHAGGLPGYPESHGCVHLPSAFAEKLFAATNMGMTVVVSETGASPESLVHPGAVSPIDALTGDALAEVALGAGQLFRWEPEKSPEGPVSLVLSTADRRLVVLRNGIEIGRAIVHLGNPGPSAGTHAYIVASGGLPGAMPPWLRIGIPGSDANAGIQLTTADLARVQVPPAFVADVLPLLVPGTVLLQIDQHLLPETTGARLQVIDSAPPEL